MTEVSAVGLTLRNWLRVDAYIKIALNLFSFVAAIMKFINEKIGDYLLIGFAFLLLLYLLFGSLWIGIGNYMFWNFLQIHQKCNGGIKNYMITILSLPIIIFCMFVTISCLKRPGLQ